MDVTGGKNTRRMKLTKQSMLTFLGSMSFFLVSKAQEWKLMPREDMEAIVHPRLMPQANNILRFDTCRLSIDTLSANDMPREIRFRYRNVSGRNVTLARVTTSCGCTVAKFSRKPLPPNEDDSILLTFHPKNKQGEVHEEALVYTTLSDRSPVARLALSGYVAGTDGWSHLPLSMGSLRLTRKQVTFSPDERKATERIACANSGDRPITPKALLLPPCLTFRAEPSVLAPGQEGDLVITLDRSKADKNTTGKGHLAIVVDGISGKPSERTIEVIIK